MDISDFGISWDLLEKCMLLRGVDMKCGACSEVFFTNMTTNSHEEDCRCKPVDTVLFTFSEE